MRVAALTLAACTVAQPVRHVPRRTDGRPIAVAGEAMDYRVSFRGITVGRVAIAIGDPGEVDGRPAIVARAHGAADGLVALIGDLTWELTTTLDRERGTVIHSEERSSVHVNGDEEAEHEERDEGYDLLAAGATVRGLPSGGSASLEVDLAGAHLAVEIHDTGPAPGFSVPAEAYVGEASEHPFEVWLSDDAARVPLRGHTSTEWGDVDVQLLDYHAPAN